LYLAFLAVELLHLPRKAAGVEAVIAFSMCLVLAPASAFSYHNPALAQAAHGRHHRHFLRAGARPDSGI
jgi:hypothetical protein